MKNMIYDSFYEVPSKDLILDSEHIEIVSYYCSSWLESNLEELKQFFKNPNSKFVMYVGDINSLEVKNSMIRIFKNHNWDILKYKVELTLSKIIDIVNTVGGSLDQVELRSIDYTLNYAIQCFDRDIFLISVFDYNRIDKIGSPVILFDLSKSHKVETYYKNEMNGIREKSKLINLDDFNIS